ncbi:unnamed protein product [Oncorhynchus mykiss]|uniref:Uncharacterized protein n=1 Tax=Oncorhynchus mykiss TaxID=8022 RepID=A0A060X9B7_ONCMY|nr:unnamed protein product [Oncorhynchus mykiss]
MQELLETKIQLLQEEAQLARGEVERMASLTGSSPQPLLEDMEDSQEEENLQTQSHHPASHTYRDRVIEELTSALRCKEAMITELSGQKSVLTLRVGELEGEVEDLSSSLLQKESDAEFYQEELGRERLRIEQEMQWKNSGDMGAPFILLQENGSLIQRFIIQNKGVFGIRLKSSHKTPSSGE